MALPGAVVPVTVEFSPRPSKCPPQSLEVGAALREILPALQNNPSTYHSQLRDEGSILQDFWVQTFLQMQIPFRELLLTF